MSVEPFDAAYEAGRADPRLQFRFTDLPLAEPPSPSEGGFHLGGLHFGRDHTFMEPVLIGVAVAIFGVLAVLAGRNRAPPRTDAGEHEAPPTSPSIPPPLTEADALAAAGRSGDVPGLLYLAGRLHQWRRGMLRGHR